MSTTVFHCILCPPEAGGKHPEFATGDALSEHLESAHQAPKRYVMRQTQRVVGKAETVTGRGGV